LPTWTLKATKMRTTPIRNKAKYKYHRTDEICLPNIVRAFWRLGTMVKIVISVNKMISAKLKLGFM